MPLASYPAEQYEVFQGALLRGEHRPIAYSVYKIVTRRFRGCSAPQITFPTFLLNIISGIFPTPERGAGHYRLPPPPCIWNKVLKVIVKCKPDIFGELFETCTSEEVLPALWKRLKLVLLPNVSKPSSYEIFCLLDTLGKMSERLIYKRLLPVIKIQGGF